MRNLWFLKRFSSQYIIKDPLEIGGNFIAVIDQGWLESYGIRVWNVVNLLEMIKRFSLLGNMCFIMFLLFPFLIWVMSNFVLIEMQWICRFMC